MDVEPRVTGYSWYVCGVLMLATAVSTLDRFLFSVLMVPIKTDLALSDTQLGILAGLGFTLLYCAMSIPFGRLADVTVRRTMIAVAIAFWSLATLGMSFANSYGALLVCRLLIGVGEAALVPAAISLIADYFDKARLGRATAVFGTGSTVGQAVAFIGGGALLSYFALVGAPQILGYAFKPWQAAILVISPAGFLVALLMLTVREPRRQATRPDAKASDLFRYMRRHAAGYGLFTVSWCCVFAVVHTLATWSPSFYSRSFDLEIARAAAIGGVVSLFAGPVGNAIGGTVIDRLESRRIAGPSGVMLCAGLLVAFLGAGLIVLSGILTVSVIGYTVVMTAALTGGPAGYTAIQKMTPARFRGLATAVIFSTASLCGLGVGPLMIGAFSDHVFTGKDSLAYAMLSVIGVFALIGSAAGYLSRPAMDRAIGAAKVS